MVDIVIPGSQVGVGSAPAGPRPVQNKEQLRAGDSLLKAAESILSFRIEQQQEADSAWETEASAQAEVTFAEILESQKENMGRGGAGYTQSVAQALEEAMPGILETGNGVASPAAIERFQTKLKADAIRATGRAGETERQAFNGWQSEIRQNEVDRGARVILDAPDQFSAVLMERLALVDRAGDLNADEKAAEKEAITKEYLEQQYEGYIQAGQYDLAEQVLSEPRAGVLSGDEVTKLRNRGNTVRTSKLAELDRIERRQDKDRQETQEQNYGQAFIDLSNDGLTTADIQTKLRRREISGTQAATLMRAHKANQTATVRDNPQVVNDLFSLEAEGLLTKDRVIQEHARGNLSDTTARTFINDSETPGPLETEEYKSALRFVDQTVGGVRGIGATLDPASSLRVAEAQNELRRRVLEGDDRPVFEIARDISERYSKDTGFMNAQDVLPLPRFAAGGRKTLDIDRTAENILSALERGEIDEREAARQSALLQKWADALNPAGGSQ